jgi:hypothetical protein
VSPDDMESTAGEQYLDTARHNLYSQAGLLQQFAGAALGIAGARLGEQQKRLGKVTKPILTRVQRAVGYQQAGLDAVVEPLMMGAQNAISEQNIQLGMAAALPAIGPRAFSTPAAPVRPLAVPRSVPAPASGAAAGVRAGAPSVSPSLTDAAIVDTTGPDGSGDVGAVSTPDDTSGATGVDQEETVTNVIAIRSCDLKAITDALSRPSYGPYLDAARGLLSGEESKIIGFFGDPFSDEFDRDPAGTVEQLFVATARATRLGLS